MISFNALLAWNLVANTLAGREGVDSSILTETLRHVVSLAYLEERRGGVRFVPTRMRPVPRPPSHAPGPCTEASCSSSHSEALCDEVELEGLEECGGGTSLLPSEIPSASHPPIDASGPCTEASCSSSHSEALCDEVELAELEECSGVRCPPSEIPSASRPPIDVSGPCVEAPNSNLSEVGNLCNMGEDRLEKYRHDIRQFILQERASVPKLTLDQVKESILEGKYPALSSLLKDSGPIRRRDPDDHLPSNFVVEQERLKRLKFSTCDNGMKISQKDPSGIVQHNQHVTDSDGTDHLQMDAVGVEGNTIQLSERNDTLEPPDKEITNLDGGKSRLSAQTAAPLFPIDCTQILQKYISIPHSNSTILPNLALNEHARSLIPTHTEENQHPSNIIVIPDSSSDDDSEDAGYKPADEMFSAEKHRLLSSQANNNQDSIAGDWTEQVNVGRRDDSTNAEKVNDELIVDKAATTVEGADTASLNEQAEDLQPTERHTPVDNGNLHCEEVNASHSASVNEQVEEDVQPTEPHTAVDNGNLPCKGGNVSRAASVNEQVDDFQPTESHTKVDNSSLPCKEGNSSHTKPDAAVVQQKGEISVGGDHRTVQDPDSDEQVKDPSDHDTDNEALASRNSGRHCKRAQGASTKTVDQERFKSSTGKRRKRAYQAKRYSNPLMPPGRRTKLLWTVEEEAALKEGMRKFVLEDGGNIPWRAILDDGCSVFHRTRMPGDLRDKWRNMKIKEGHLH